MNLLIGDDPFRLFVAVHVDDVDCCFPSRQEGQGLKRRRVAGMLE